jgi:hypothetical protein
MLVEAGHHQRRLQSLTGLDVQENQARRLLNDLNAFTAHLGLQGEDPQLAAHQWLSQIYEPIVQLVPADIRADLEPAEIFHEILEHRWYLSEWEGYEVGIFETARDYIRKVLGVEPVENPDLPLRAPEPGRLRAGTSAG